MNVLDVVDTKSKSNPGTKSGPVTEESFRVKAELINVVMIRDSSVWVSEENEWLLLSTNVDSVFCTSLDDVQPVVKDIVL
jgi:hypothetical protein